MPPDAGLLLSINRLAGRVPPLDSLVRLAVSDYLIPLVLFLILLGLWIGPQNATQRGRNQRAVVLAAAGMGIAHLAVILLQGTFHFNPWPRPFETFPEIDPELLFYRPWDPSFPCHAAAIGFALSTGILLHNRRAGIIMYFATALWSFARIYVGVHYPLDVVGGWAVGAFSSYVAHKAAPLLEPLLSLLFRALSWLCLADVQRTEI